MARLHTHSVIGLLAFGAFGCRRATPTPTPTAVQAGPNALDPNSPQPAPGPAQPARAGERVSLAVGVVEGRSKPPDRKPNEDLRLTVRPEWYPTGQPQNPYPPGVMIPAQAPSQGVSIQPWPSGQAMPGGGAPGAAPGAGGGAMPMPPMPMPGNGGVAMQPMPAPTGGQPTVGQPVAVPPQPTVLPPGQVGMQPIPPPGQMGQPVPVQPVPPGQGAPGQGVPGQAIPPAMGGQVQTVEGVLNEQNRGAEGRFEAYHAVSLRRGQRVDMSLESAAFDTVLRVVPPTGEAMENDDIDTRARNYNSRLDFTAPIDGQYRVVVTSYEPGRTGPYTLRYAAGEPGQGMTTTAGATAPPGAQTGAGGELVAGTPVNEYLSPGDPSSGGRYVRSYRLSGQQGEMITLRAESSAFDTTLALVAPNGQRWTNDDTTPEDTNSTLQVTLPAAGAYRVEVSSYRQGATGPFALTRSSSQAPTVAANGQVSGSVAGRRGAGSMYGVFVGITDYGGSNNLYGCADDARQLAMAYINARLGSAGQFIVLTDAQATTAAVREAMTTMAGRVGPNDVFMFFHSGHGSRHASQNAQVDPDGYVETIVMRDGEISSHDLARMFDTVRADVNMLALDSCYSGGFRRAFGSNRNRFGMYSSEEDVLSQVAQRFQAGGYLSYFLRRGVTDGDSNRDGTLRAGELSDYLYAQYAQNRTSMQTQDGSDNNTWQNLVIDRSGVALSDLLWRFPVRANAAGFAAQ
ncbi:MAG: caspase family protein [Myxococcales bacterium]|nr:caspase family protein [Myxococcales bacterium]